MPKPNLDAIGVNKFSNALNPLKWRRDNNLPAVFVLQNKAQEPDGGFPEQMAIPDVF